VHCDPHPGNILIVPKESASQVDRVALLDHGLYRSIDENFRLHNCGLWKAMALQQRAQVEGHCEALGIGQLADVLPALLTNRPLESRTALGEDLPPDEILQARGITKGMALNELVSGSFPPTSTPHPMFTLLLLSY
jgi:aarF domain-containing kinase